MEDDDLRWTWYDNQYGGPSEDQLEEPPRLRFAHATGTIEPEALKAALAARAAAYPPPEHWGRKLGRALSVNRIRRTVKKIVWQDAKDAWK